MADSLSSQNLIILCRGHFETVLVAKCKPNQLFTNPQTTRLYYISAISFYNVVKHVCGKFRLSICTCIDRLLTYGNAAKPSHWTVG